MDPLESFIEFAQWKGSVEEAQERLNAAGGDVAVALEHLYSGLFENDPVDQSQRAPRAEPVVEPEIDPSLAQFANIEINKEYTKDLVKNPVPRLGQSAPLLVYLNPTLNAIAQKVDLFLSTIGLGGAFDTLPTLYKKIEEERPRYFKEVIEPLLDNANVTSVELRQKLTKHQNLRFNEAVEMTKSQLNFLIVVVSNELDPKGNAAMFESLQKTGIFDESQVDFWFTSVLQVEGFNVAKALKFDCTPAFAMISPSPKTAQSSVIVMERLLKMSGLANPRDVSLNVRASIANHEAKLVSLRLVRQRFDADRNIREQQDDAYQRSLEKDRKRSEEAKNKNAEIEKQKTKEINEAHLLEAWKGSVFKRAKLIQENQKQNSNTPCARIAVRLADGKRIPLNVPSGTTLDDLYCLVYSHLNQADENQQDDIDTFENELKTYEPKYGFGLVSPILRKTLPHDLTVIDELSALWPSGILMVDME